MSSITTAFADALGTVLRPGTFCVAGSEQMFAPGLEVEGVGPIGLPLPEVQAEQLVAIAERAPYGRGTETVTDTAVRRTWQIGADRVRMRGKHWAETLKTIVTRVAEGLGVADPIDAELYKLLIYDEGSFFVPHRDTEKSPGMFATLVLVLPSVSEGGALIVRHKGHEARIALQCEDPSDVAFAAFYADCVHEVLPVTAGYRLVLVYNLLRRGSGRLPEVPNYDNEVAMVAERLARWAEALRADGTDEPRKLIYSLEHAYTPAEFGFDALKGADAGIGQVVVAAAERAGCSVHLALVSIEQSGIAQQTGGFGYSRRGRYDDDDTEDEEFEVVEVCEHRAVASEWLRPDGVLSALTDVPVEETEFSPPLSFEELEPDEEHFHEATGNEGASFERTYRRAALILWPREQLLAVINQGGLRVTLPYLEDLVNRWADGSDPAIRAQAGALSELMIAGWPMSRWYRKRDAERSDVGRFLSLLVRLEDSVRLDRFLTELAGRRGFDVGDCADIAEALRVLPEDRAGALAQSLIEGAVGTALGACGALLARVAEWNPAVVRRAARTLVDSLPGETKRLAPGETGQQNVQPAFIVDLFTALGAIDAEVAAVAADHVLAWPGTYDFDTVLVPAILVLREVAQTADLAAVQRLRAACAAHLDRRIALALEPPGDWRRDDTVGCSCQDCRALARYLGDAGQKVWVFAAAQHRRSHVESTIRDRRCDVDFTTEKRGSPHRLVCTKNDASYQRRCVQRANDLRERARLGAS
jgi:predicted 2-oxoglutarate/Fe(II)-dependent dioxygenase YbiX